MMQNHKQMTFKKIKSVVLLLKLNVLLTYLCKNITLPVLIKKKESECYKVFFAITEVNNPNWSDFSKCNAKKLL